MFSRKLKDNEGKVAVYRIEVDENKLREYIQNKIKDTGCEKRDVLRDLDEQFEDVWPRALHFDGYLTEQIVEISMTNRTFKMLIELEEPYDYVDLKATMKEDLSWKTRKGYPCDNRCLADCQFPGHTNGFCSVHCKDELDEVQIKKLRKKRRKQLKQITIRKGEHLKNFLKKCIPKKFTFEWGSDVEISAKFVLVDIVEARVAN